MQLDKNILAWQMMLKNVEKTKAYDGWSDTEMLEHFIQQEGYNPIEEFKTMTKELWSQYSIPSIQSKYELVKENSTDTSLGFVISVVEEATVPYPNTNKENILIRSFLATTIIQCLV